MTVQFSMLSLFKMSQTKLAHYHMPRCARTLGPPSRLSQKVPDIESKHPTKYFYNKLHHAYQAHQTNAKCERVRKNPFPLTKTSLTLSQLQPRTHNHRPTLSSIHQIRLQKNKFQARAQERNSQSQAQTRFRPQTEARKSQKCRRRLWC
jgi:hypothetical protein